jgi:hypothetical protein
MLYGFSIARRRRLGVRQLAAAFMPNLLGIEWINRAFTEGASKLAHSKGFASGKNHAALGEMPAFRPAAPELVSFEHLESHPA